MLTIHADSRGHALVVEGAWIADAGALEELVARIRGLGCGSGRCLARSTMNAKKALTVAHQAGTITRVIEESMVAEGIEWRERASCLSYPAILFFGMDDVETPAERRAREDQAKLVCSTCGVRDECLEYALTMREPYGIWGGLTEIERKARLRAAGQARTARRSAL